jgi:phospholipase/carboxylesterase
MPFTVEQFPAGIKNKPGYFCAMRSFLLILFTGYALSVSAQTSYPLQLPVEGFGYVEVIKGNDNGKLPLLIAFHYSSGTPSETVADYASLKLPVRLIIPRGNFSKRNGFSYYPADYYQKDSNTQFQLAKNTVDSIAAFVSAIEKKYKQKAIVSGISQGGDIAFLLAVYYPELCRASFPFAAVIHSQVIEHTRKHKIKKVPLFLFQGEADEIVLVGITRYKVSKLTHPLQLKLYTYPGLGHDISPAMKSDYSKLIDELNNK